VSINAFFLIGCKDKDHDHESLTSEPAKKNNYWSQSTCKIDGHAWGDCFPSLIKGSRASGEWYKNFEGDPLQLHFANVCDSPFTEINISLKKFNGIGSYSLSTDNYAEYNVVYMLDRTQYRTNLVTTGKVSITKFDTARREISGTYEFGAFNSDSNTTRVITNGVFNRIIFSIL
jgi:hypothetical protein